MLQFALQFKSHVNQSRLCFSHTVLVKITSSWLTQAPSEKPNPIQMRMSVIVVYSYRFICLLTFIKHCD